MNPQPQAIDCLFIHGWGMNPAIWQPLLDILPHWVNCHLYTLPGHGQRQHDTLTDLQHLSHDLAAQCKMIHSHNRPLMLVGWSLGALPCLQLASHPSPPCDGLLLVSSNPRFIMGDHWQAGVDSSVFDQFAHSLDADFSGTIRRFLSLQVKGSESGRGILRSLRQRILQQPAPQATSLQAGLRILKQSDLRAQLESIQLPVSWALGEQDGLVKIELADCLRKLMPAAEIRNYKGAGHAPFLSHSEAFAQQLLEFAHSMNPTQ